mgnify:CR=1 FL=1
MTTETPTRGFSPIVLVPTEMDFPAAMRAVRDGKRITKKEWEDPRAYGLLHEGRLRVHLAAEHASIFHDWIVSDGDLSGEDWIVLE